MPRPKQHLRIKRLRAKGWSIKDIATIERCDQADVRQALQPKPTKKTEPTEIEIEARIEALRRTDLTKKPSR